ARANEGTDVSFSFAAAIQVKYESGARRDAQITRPIRRCRGADSICRDRGARHRQVVDQRPYMAEATTTGWGLIAGNGRFPFLVLEGARSQGIDMAVIALKEEASEELASSAKRLHWVSLGELSKAIDLMHQEGVTRAVMAGQVKHNKIFSSIRPDWKL